jgi:hypothetical protein
MLQAVIATQFYHISPSTMIVDFVSYGIDTSLSRTRRARQCRIHGAREALHPSRSINSSCAAKNACTSAGLIPAKTLLQLQLTYCPRI